MTDTMFGKLVVEKREMDEMFGRIVRQVNAIVAAAPVEPVEQEKSPGESIETVAEKQTPVEEPVEVVEDALPDLSDTEEMMGILLSPVEKDLEEMMGKLLTPIEKNKEEPSSDEEKHVEEKKVIEDEPEAKKEEDETPDVKNEEDVAAKKEEDTQEETEEDKKKEEDKPEEKNDDAEITEVEPTKEDGKKPEESEEKDDDKKREEERKKNQEEAEKIVCEGWCTKQGHILKNWKLRWFSLKNAQLTYRKQKEDVTFIRSLSVDSRCKMITDFSKNPKLAAIKGPMYGFQAGNGTIYYCQVENEEEKTRWIEALEKVISLNEYVGQAQASAGISTPGSGFSNAWANAYMKKHPELLAKEPPAYSRIGDLLVLTDILAMPVKNEKTDGEGGAVTVHMCFPGSGAGAMVSFRFHFNNMVISAGVSCMKPVHWVIHAAPGEHVVGGSFPQQGFVANPKHEKRTFNFSEGEWAVYVQSNLGAMVVTAIEKLEYGKIEQGKLDMQVEINKEKEKERQEELKKMGIVVKPKEEEEEVKKVEKEEKPEEEKEEKPKEEEKPTE